MPDLKDKLVKQGFAFDFFQVVRLLEQSDPSAPPVGNGSRHDREKVRLRPNHSLGFPPGDVHSVELLDETHGIWRVTQNFLGLYGVSSPLPPYFAEMVAQGDLEKDPLREFLDLFNNRAISLYYRAWKKNNLAAQADPARPDPLTLSLCTALGAGEDVACEDWAVSPLRLVRYFALLTNESRPADGLESLISDYFAVPGVKVRQFLPHRFKLRSHERSLLGDSGANQQLGGSLILGDRVLDRAGQFRLSLGPLDRDGFLKLQPGEPDFAELVFLVKLYVRNQLDFELELILDSQQVEPLRLSHQQQRHTLGRYSWLSQPKAETVRTVIHTETEQNGGGKC